MNNENIITPCISICRSDPLTDYCYGCGRTSEDKKNWSDPNMTNEWKKQNLIITQNRLNGWQKDAWEKSYAHKKITGNSLLKEKLIQQKK